MEISTKTAQNNARGNNDDFINLEIRVPNGGEDRRGNKIDPLFGYLNMPKRLFADPNDISKIQAKFKDIGLSVEFREEAQQSAPMF